MHAYIFGSLGDESSSSILKLSNSNETPLSDADEKLITSELKRVREAILTDEQLNQLYELKRNILNNSIPIGIMGLSDKCVNETIYNDITQKLLDDADTRIINRIKYIENKYLSKYMQYFNMIEDSMGINRVEN